MRLEMVSICVNACLSAIAIIVSIIAIRNQTKEQKLQNAIQLFDKRVEIFSYIMEIFKMANVVYKDYKFPENINRLSYEQFCKIMSKKQVSNAQIDMLIDISDKGDLLRPKALGLLDKELGDFVVDAIDLYSDFVDTIVAINGFNKRITRKHYLTLKRMFFHINKARVMEQFDKYLNLRDVCRK